MEQRSLTVKALVEAAVMVALATVLSVIVIYSAPQGGSVTPASMVPLLVLSLRRGPRVGIMAGAVYGVIQFWIQPFAVHWLQVVLDYPLAFALLGLAGFFPRRPYLGVLVAIVGRGLSHLISGVVYFGSLAPEGVSPWVYSGAYNASYLVPELALSLALVLFLSLGGGRRLLERAG